MGKEREGEKENNRRQGRIKKGMDKQVCREQEENKRFQFRVGGRRSILENTGSIILSWVFESWYLKNMQIKKMDFQKYFEITV